MVYGYVFTTMSTRINYSTISFGYRIGVIGVIAQVLLFRNLVETCVRGSFCIESCPVKVMRTMAFWER